MSLSLSLPKTPEQMDILSQAETQSSGDLGTSRQEASTQNNDAPAFPSHPKCDVLVGGLQGWAYSEKIWHVALLSTPVPRSDKFQLAIGPELVHLFCGKLSLNASK